MLHWYRQFHYFKNTINFYEDIKSDEVRRLDTSNYEVERTLPIRKSKKLFGLMKNTQGMHIKEQFVNLIPKM